MKNLDNPFSLLYYTYLVNLVTDLEEFNGNDNDHRTTINRVETFGY